jgi:copper(I)-binding protein
MREFLVQYRFRFTLLISCVALILVACGDGDDGSDDIAGSTIDDNPPGVTTRDAWIREAVLPEGSPAADPEHDHEETASSGVISALYLALENNTGTAVQLTGVETGVARVVEMHQTQSQNGLMQMRPVESVEVPASGEAVFEPGRFHIMLIDINRPLEPGDEVAVTLIFNTGERLELPAVPVREA